MKGWFSLNESRESIKKLRRQATSGARWTGVATTIRVATQFIQLAVLARLLHVSDFGLMGLTTVVITFGEAFGDFGISNAIIHYQDATRRELSSLYWLNVLAGFTVFALVWAAAPLVLPIFHQERLPGLIRLASPVFIIIPVGRQFQVLLERELRFRRIAFIETITMTAGAVVGIVYALRGGGVYSLVWAFLTQAGVRAVMLAASGWREWRPALQFRWGDCTRFVRFGMYQMGDRSLNILSQQLDKILIGGLMGPTQLGYYELAYRLIVRPYQIINPIFTRVAFPVFSRVQQDIDRMRKGFLEMIEVIAAAMAPLYFVMIALAGPIIRVQLGSDYDPCIPLLRILAVLGFFYAIGNPFGSILLALGRANVSFYMNASRTVLFGVAIWLGAPFGLQGIAWALVFTLVCIMVPVGIWIRWWLMRLRASEYLGALVPFLAVAGVISAALYAACEYIPWPNDVVLLIVLGAAAVGAYWLILKIQCGERLKRILSIVRS